MGDYIGGMPSKDARFWAMLCHLSALSGFIIPIPFANIIVPAAIWFAKKDKDSFIDEQGRESLNFQVSVTIYAVISGLLILVVIGFVLLPIVYIFGLICVIIAAIKANDGQNYRYPLTIRLFN